jgi:chemotaxis protein MotA
MLILVGLAIVFISVIGGFMMAGGHPGVLMHASEFVVIFGMAGGVLVVATPLPVIKEVIAKIKESLGGKSDTKDTYLDLFKLSYEIFLVGRRNGLIALEEHVMNPSASSIFSKYPAFAANHQRMEFFVNGMRPIIDGKIKPDQLETLLNAELHAKEAEATHPVHALQLIADSLPAIGIVAAVLGIINTMSAIADGPEAVGAKVAAALTGTMLGVFSAYGVVAPLAGRIQSMNDASIAYLRCTATAIAGFAKGMAPITAIEVARRTVSHDCQPGADELEELLKTIK